MSGTHSEVAQGCRQAQGDCRNKMGYMSLHQIWGTTASQSSGPPHPSHVHVHGRRDESDRLPYSELSDSRTDGKTFLPVVVRPPPLVLGGLRGAC
jgi:hypothetical protein